MVFRSRSVDLGVYSGSVKVGQNGSLTYVDEYRGYDRCDDDLTVEFTNRDKGLWIYHNNRTGGIFSGGRTNLTGPRFFNTPYPTAGYDGKLLADLSAGSETEAASALRAAAMTNPSRNEVQLPVFIWELKDIPSILKFGMQVFTTPNKTKLGRKVHAQASKGVKAFTNWVDAGRPKGGSADKLVQQGAGAWIAYNFGIAPLISDLKDLITFADSVSKRKNELSRLASGSGLKRRVTLLDYSSPLVKTADWPFWSTGATLLRAPLYAQSTLKRWAVLRWKPDGTAPIPSSDDDVRNIILGLNASSMAGHVWEALPWSWLVDYFFNVGGLINSENNAVPARVTSSCVMTTSTRKVWHPQYTWTFPGGDVCVISAGSRTIETKSRGIALPGFSGVAKFAALGDKQLSILGSLAIMRGPR